MRLAMAVSMLMSVGFASNIYAQRERGDQGPGGPGGPARMMRMMPLMAAIDADGNGEISAEEIEKATAALKNIDKNKDGKLTEDELRPNFAGGFGGPGGPGGPGGIGGLAGILGGRGLGEDFVGRLLEMDRNKDGKLSKDEVPERMQPLFARADSDKDGVITKEELAKVALGEGRSEREGRGPEGREGGRGPLGGQGGLGIGGFGFGPPNASELVNRLFELDTDKDQKLSRDELGKIAEVMGRLFGREGGPREGGRRDGEGGERREGGRGGDRGRRQSPQ